MFCVPLWVGVAGYCFLSFLVKTSTVITLKMHFIRFLNKVGVADSIHNLCFNSDYTFIHCYAWLFFCLPGTEALLV